MHSLSPLRVAIVSDTHGFLDPRIAQRVAECDLALHAGDIGDLTTLRALRPRGEVFAVRGNNDTPALWPREEHEALLAIPHERRVALPGGDIVLLHGHRAGSLTGIVPRLRASYPQVRAVVFGHSHSMVADTDHAPWVLNPGAAGRRLTRGGASCLILTVSATHWHVEKLRFTPREDEEGGRMMGGM